MQVWQNNYTLKSGASRACIIHARCQFHLPVSSITRHIFQGMNRCKRPLDSKCIDHLASKRNRAIARSWRESQNWPQSQLTIQWRRIHSQQIDLIQPSDCSARPANIFTDGPIRHDLKFRPKNQKRGASLIYFPESRGLQSNYLFDSDWVVSVSVLIEYLLRRSAQNSASGSCREFTGRKVRVEYRPRILKFKD
jgi:hypothetical protein